MSQNRVRDLSVTFSTGRPRIKFPKATLTGGSLTLARARPQFYDSLGLCDSGSCCSVHRSFYHLNSGSED